jgi:flagellar hook-associated protein 1 FlgK
VSVTYVGFASVMQVNQDILDNISLLQQGTYTSDRTIPESSNEVIRRVIQYAFGDVNYQEAAGLIDLNFVGPATDLQSWLGLDSRNNVVGGADLSQFGQIDDGVAGTPDMMEDLQEFFPNYPADDQFQITFEEPRTGLGPVTVTIDLSDASANFPIGGPINNALDQIIAEINSQITLAGLPAGLTATATRNTYGQLSIQSNGNIQLDASSFAGAMGTDSFSALGWSENTYTTEDPYFDVQVGNNNPVRITIEPGDDVNDLINKLEYDPVAGTGVPGLLVTFDALTGRLTLRPGMDDSNGGPEFGGDIRLVSGPGTTTGAVNPVLAALPAGVNVVSALFGSYTVSGTTVTNTSPVADVAYRSETYVGSGVYTGFRRNFLGPEANVSTDILTGTSITDYSQKMINAQMQDIIQNSTMADDETSLRDLLQERLLNESGVNIDEELSNLIVIQTAYAAAARAVTAADEMFTDLLNAI